MKKDCERSSKTEEAGCGVAECQSPLVFKRLTLESLEEIYPYLLSSGSSSCDYSAGGIYMWIDYFKYKYCIYEDTLFIKGVAEDNVERKAFSMPIGKLPLRESVRLLCDYCDEHGYQLVFSAITEEVIDRFKALEPECVTSLDQWADYIYSIDALASLSGKKLSKKRNHCNRFALDYPEATFESIDDDNIDAVRKCFTEICETAKDTPMAEFERGQVWHVLDHLKDYPFESMCLKVGDDVIGFTVGEVVNKVVHVHIEKALHSYNGATETLNRRFADFIHMKYPRVEEVNREDDAGDEGLRQAKMSYYPTRLLNKFNVSF